MTNITALMNKNRSAMVPVKKAGQSVAHAIAAIQEDMNRMFHRYFGEYDLPAWDALLPDMPATNIVENEKAFAVTMDVPGMEPENIEIEAREGYLTVRGERKEEKEEKGATWLRREISEGEFRRTIALPDTAQCDRAEASFKNGTLCITVPKKADAQQKPKRISVKKAA